MNTARRLAATSNKLLALTLGRLLLIPVVIVSLDVVPVVTFAALLAFVVLDLYDGVAARQLNEDDVTRRVLDSVVDRISIWSVYVAAALGGLLPWSLLLVLAARDIYCGYWCFQLVSKRDIAIKADWLYRSLNLTLAGWIVAAPLLASGLREDLFVATCVYSAVVAVDLRRSVGIALGMKAGIRSQVIPARVLRKARRPTAAMPSPELTSVSSA